MGENLDGEVGEGGSIEGCGQHVLLYPDSALFYRLEWLSICDLHVWL